MGFLLGFLNPRNVGIIGLIALSLFLKSNYNVDLDDYHDDEINPQARTQTNSQQSGQSGSALNSRAPASQTAETLSFTNSRESTLSKASSSRRANDFYERDQETSDFESNDRGDRDAYARANEGRNANNIAYNNIPAPSALVNPTNSMEDSFNDQTSGGATGNEDTRGDFLGGGFSKNPTAKKDQGPADTFNFNNVGEGNDPNSGATTPDIAPICSANQSAGTYISEISLSLNCNQPARIFYCIGSGGSCCDPSTSPTEFTGAFPVGTTDGDYCVSFYGQSTKSLLTSDNLEISYLVNSALPSLMTQFPKVQVQTTELPLMAHTQSVDFGIANHYLHQVNTKEHDPSALVWGCEDVLDNYSLLSGATPTLLNHDVSGLSDLDQIDQQFEMPSLQYGNNFFTTILEDRDRMLMGCLQQNIIVRDFQVFSLTASAPTTPSSSGSFGGFVSYGHFQEIPNVTQSGSGVSVQTTQVLEEGFLAITH